MTIREAASWRLRLALEHAPRLYVAFDRWRGNSSFTPIHPGTALVISGYGSSGNTYLRAATLAANPGLQIASHAHNSTEVALAVRRGLPTVFLVRDPVQAVASVLVRYAPAFSEYALVEYAHLYERTAPLRSRLLVATFDEATSDAGGIINRINTRFGTSFEPFRDADRDAVRAVTEQMRAYDAGILGDRAAVAGAAPSAERQQRKAAMIRELSMPDHAALLARCRAAYDAITTE